MPESQKKLVRQQVMATRVYRLEGSTPPRYITVRLGFPRKIRGQKLYEVPVELVGLGRRSLRFPNGADAFVALQLALISLGTDLKYMSGQVNCSLTWNDGNRTDIGFPVYHDYSLVPIMSPEQSSAKPTRDQRKGRSRSRKDAPP